MKLHIVILILMSMAFIPEVIAIFKLLSQTTASVKLPAIALKWNGFIFLIGLLMLALAILYDVNYLNYKAPIEYSNWEKIEWSDFRAIKRPRQTLHGSENFAFICSEIKCEFKKDQIEVVTLFHPSRSYTFSTELAGNNLLKHELYHLHITEYWSRQLRKAIIESGKSKQEVLSLVKEYSKREREMQYQYDDETYHGYVLNMQRAWQVQIDSSLLNLSSFSKKFINTKN